MKLFLVGTHAGGPLDQLDQLTNLPNLPHLPNFVKIKNPLNVLKLNFSNFIFILEYFIFNLSTCWVQSGVKSKGFSKIKQIRLFRPAISENLECLELHDRV